MKQSNLKIYFQKIFLHFEIIIIFIIYFFLSCQDPGFKVQGSDRIVVLTTDPVGNSFTNGNRIVNVITSLIDHAQSSVYMAVYNFDSQPVLDSLIKAKNRGLIVQIVGDYHERDSYGYRALNDQGIRIVAGNLNAIQHNKFIILDDNTLITGTGNISHSDFYNNDNHFLVIFDQAIVNIYKKEFFQMYTGFFSILKSSHRMSSDRPKTKLPVEIFFSPEESQVGVKRMIQKINSATDSIYYMIYAFSHDEIATALIMAARRGVKVYGIHDSSFIKGISQEAPRLYMAGFNEFNQPYTNGPVIHSDGNTNTFTINGIEHGGKMHCKTMIIDPDTDHGIVLTGSFNWSNNAVENNDENLLIISDNSVVKEIKHQWDQAWKISRPLSYAFSEINGSVANSDEIYISEINSAGSSNGSTSLQDDDFIEIYNNSLKPIDLSHWTITWSAYKNSKTDGDFASYSFPDKNNGGPLANAVIFPGEYRLIYGRNSGVNATAAAFMQNAIKIPDSKGFTLSAESFKIELYDRSMNKIDYADMPYALREGYFDPLIKKTASMNRRLKLNGQPDSGWYTSKIECLWAICQSSFYNASPGYKNEASGPVIFKSMEINSDQTFSAAFSGSINNCINKTDYTVFNKTGNVPIENIFLQKSSNKLTFQINGAGDQLQSYEIRSRSFNEFMANSILYVSPNIFMGTDSGLSISRDNGLTFQDLYVNGNENQKVYKIVLDSATSLIYIAASNGLFFTSDNGLTFQKIQITASLLSNIVFNVAINTGFIVAAAGDGLYIADKSLLNFQKILLMPIYSIYFTDTLLLAGGNNLVFRFFSPFTASPVIISLNGVVHDIKLLGSTYFLTATSGLYTSSDGINYFPAYVGIFSNKVPGLTAQDSMNNPLILSHDQISGIYPAGVQTFDMRLNQKSINNNSLAVSGLNFLVAGDYGFLTGSSLDLLSNINSFTCSVEQTLPAGSLVFNGYGTFADRQPATLLLNEMSLVNSDGKDWLEYYVTSSGTLKNISIEYLEADSFEIIFGFPDMYVNAGDVIMIYLESALDQNKTIGNDISFVRSTPYKFYSTHININRGDGILMVRKNNDIEDVLYYSNYDGNISSGFAHGLYEVYFNSSMQNLLTKPLPFPVNGWNDAEVQNSGVKIPDLGGSRAIVRTSLFQNIWKVESIPTPGVK